MLSFEAARARLLRDISLLEAEWVPLEQALGRVLAAPLVARSPIPPFSYSAMDGYALATRDLTGAGPWQLRVAGESQVVVASPRHEGVEALVAQPGNEV